LMKTSDRRKLINTKISDNNFRLNSKYKNCNLHIRNIPYQCTETNLHDAFTEFGEIQSIKIQKYTLVTKVNGELKEIPTSKGFGYVCFTTEESAIKARDHYNGKFLPKFEHWKRPLLIEFFMPKMERQTVYSKIQQQYNPNVQKKMPFYPMGPQFGNMFNPMMYAPMNFPPNMPRNIKQPQMVPINNQMGQMPNQGFPNKQIVPTRPIPQQQPHVTTSKKEEPDVHYMASLEDDNSRKDYLGEFIFKKIENHSFSQERHLTIDTIGKITGMILGIEDLNEIIEICKNDEQLTLRIQEALELLEGVPT